MIGCISWRRGNNETASEENRQRAIDEYQTEICGWCGKRVRQDRNGEFYGHECVAATVKGKE